MITGPRYKICKRLGSGVFEKCQTQKFQLSEARRGAKRKTGRKPRTLSDFGRQLLEKQKVRYAYGVPERQLARYTREAVEGTGDPTVSLLSRLETRLDNVVYRLGLAPTRLAARQLFSHGHIAVGERRVTIPSFAVKPGDRIGVRERSRTRGSFGTLGERLKEVQLPVWLSLDPALLEGTVMKIPTPQDISLPFDLSSVVNYYGR